MKIAYIDCFSGVAGDMLLAALLDAGAPLEELLAGLRTITPIKDEWDLKMQRVTRGMGSIAAAHVNVMSKYEHRPVAPPAADAENMEHTNSYTHDHSHGQDHGHSHNNGHSHSHNHVQGHSHNHEHAESTSETAETADGSVTHHAEPVRNLTMIRDMLQGSTLPPIVKERSIEVFTALGEAEAKTHGSTVDEVHFHEVGAIDSIIDTVGTVLALYLLGVEKVYCSALPFGEGTVWTAHGILPVPAPAALRLMMGLPVCPGPKSGKGELVTPTGAALVRVLSSEFGRPPPFSPLAIGTGAGTKDFEKHPNILRVMIGELLTSPPTVQPVPVEDICSPPMAGPEALSTRTLCVLEANIDDMTGEVGGYLMDKVLGEGALDAWVSPAIMKKGRPAYTVHVLCELQEKERLMRVVFVESTTLGIRSHTVERCSLRRQMITSSTAFGDVRIKVAWLGDKVVSAKPEYEDCKALAVASGVPLQVVMDQARAGAQSKMEKLSP